MFDPECFGKTCKNLVYNVPEAKSLMESEPNSKEANKEMNAKAEADTEEEEQKEQESDTSIESFDELQNQDIGLLPEDVTALLDNLKKMEWEEDVVQNIDSEQVKNLLGSLYMEMLFPHNDKYRFFRLEDHIESSVFNKKA